MAATNTPAPAPLSKAVVFTTSGLGGILGWVVVHPFNTLAVRMNLASAASAGPPKSFAAFSTNLIKSEGVAGLYAGLSAGCLRQVFYATSRLGLYETFRDIAAEYRKTDFAQRFFLASVSGGCAALISCPVEVCLVRMSNDASLPAAERRGYTGVFDAMTRVAREEGLPAFFRGSQPFVYRAMVVGGTQVATYDQLKQVCARTHNARAAAAAVPSRLSFAYARARVRVVRLAALCGNGARQWDRQPVRIVDVGGPHLLAHHHAPRVGQESHGLPDRRRDGQDAMCAPLLSPRLLVPAACHVFGTLVTDWLVRMRVHASQTRARSRQSGRSPLPTASFRCGMASCPTMAGAAATR